MHRISTSHFVKPRTTTYSHKITFHTNKTISSTRQTHSHVTLSKLSFASNIISTQQSRTNFEIPKTTVSINSRLYFNRRRPKKKSKPIQSEPQVEQTEDEEPQPPKPPKFSAKYKNIPEYNTYIEKALSLMESDPHEAIVHAAMAFETLNGVKNKEIIGEGFLTCKEIMASCYMRLKDYESAQKSIDEMLSISPNSFRAYVKRARIFYETGDFQQADAWFAKALKEVPTDGKTYIRRAYALIKLGKVEDAHELIEQGLRLMEGHDTLLYWKALGLAALQKYEEASQALDLAMLQPNAVLDCHRLKAMILQESGRFEEAAQAAEVGVQKIQKMRMPDEKLLHMLWTIQGACYVSVGKFNEAIESLQHLPPAAQSYLTLGYCYYEAKEYQIALDFFEQAIPLSETPAEQALGRFRKSMCLFKLDNKQETKQQFEESIELGLHMYYLGLFTAKGHKAMELQKASDVLALVQHAAGPEYSDFRVLIIRAIVLIKIGKVGEAVSVLKQASEQGCDPEILKDLEKAALMESGRNAFQRLALAHTLQATDIVKAATIYEKVLSTLAGLSSEVIYRTCTMELAKCYLKLQQYDKAEKCAQQALDSGETSALPLLADALFYQGKFKQSLSYYDIIWQQVSPFLSIKKKTDEAVQTQDDMPKFQPLFSYTDMAAQKAEHKERVLAINPDFANAMLNKATAHFTLKQFDRSAGVCQALEEHLVQVATSHVPVLQQSVRAHQVSEMGIEEHTQNVLNNTVVSTAEADQASSVIEVVNTFLIRVIRLQALNFLSLNKPDLAEQAYDKCIEIQDSLDNFQQKIRFLMNQKRYEDVIKTCEEGIEAVTSKDDRRELLEIEARTFMLLKDHDHAIDTFKRLLKISKQKWRVLFNIAVLYRKMGFPEKALKTFNEALTYKTSTEIPGEYLRGISLEKARCFISMEAYERAAKYLEEFIQLSQQERVPVKYGFTVLWNLAYCYYQLGNFAKMEEISMGLVRRHPENPVSHYVLGLALQGLEKHSQALECFNKSLEIQPNQAEVENATVRLVQRLAGIASMEGKQMSAPSMSMEQST